MTIEIYQIDAFASEVFKGNPAAVCPLNDWISDDLMQKIAMENNLSETAFYVKSGDAFDIRFFSPSIEIDLCGHATLATAFVEFEIKNNTNTQLKFNSKGGELKVTKNNSVLTLDFPLTDYEKTTLTEGIKIAFIPKPIEAYKTNNHLLLVFNDAKSVENLNFDLNKIAELDATGVCVTAIGNNHDFVSRFFAPKVGINEDPVTGSAHTFLTPFWSKKLNKNILEAKQVSPRGGELTCELTNKRVLISGKAKLYLKGEITL